MEWSTRKWEDVTSFGFSQARRVILDRESRNLILILEFISFSASYQAFAEFIDNSIQATSMNNTKDMDRVIEVHVFLKDVSRNEETFSQCPTSSESSE